MIKLDSEYCINYLDGRNITLVRKYKPTKAPIKGEAKEKTEETVGYYATVQGAVMAYRRLMAAQMVKEVDNLVDFVAKMEALDKRILKGLRIDMSTDLETKVKEIDAALKTAKAKSGKETGGKETGGKAQ